jgi:hypothetical protein
VKTRLRGIIQYKKPENFAQLLAADDPVLICVEPEVHRFIIN